MAKDMQMDNAASSFSVIAEAARGIDGISETDGLKVSSANLGPGLENGALVAQDGRNVLPVKTRTLRSCRGKQSPTRSSWKSGNEGCI